MESLHGKLNELQKEYESYNLLHKNATMTMTTLWMYCTKK